MLKFTSNKRILNDVTMLKVTQYIYIYIERERESTIISPLLEGPWAIGWTIDPR